MTTQTTPRANWIPNFKTQAEYLLAAMPAQISTKDWHQVLGMVASRLETTFVEGMQEARERIKHDPALAN